MVGLLQDATVKVCNLMDTVLHLACTFFVCVKSIGANDGDGVRALFGWSGNREKSRLTGNLTRANESALMNCRVGSTWDSCRNVAGNDRAVDLSF